MPMSDASSSRRVHFDPTINLGHILTAVAFLVSTTVAWAWMDARVTVAERDVKNLKDADREIITEHRQAISTAEVRLMSRINEERARLDQTQVRIADDIREIKQLMRDGFKDLDAKLDRKVDKPGR